MGLLSGLASAVLKIVEPSAPKCTSYLTLSGKRYGCDSPRNHGWAHHCREVEAVWVNAGNSYGSADQ